MEWKIFLRKQKRTAPSRYSVLPKMKLSMFSSGSM